MANPESATEIIRRIHFDRHALEVGEWPDAPDKVELRAVGKDNIDYFGPINLILSPTTALQLGRALVAAAEEKGAT